jgi:hypothetical protein
MALPARKPKTGYILLLVAAIGAFVLLEGRNLFGEGALTGGVADRAPAQDPKVNALKALPALELERPADAGDYKARRNLFDYATNPELQRLERERQLAQQRAERERAEAEAKRRAEQAKLPPQPPPPPLPPPPPTPPAFGYNYIGYLGPLAKTELLAVLLKRGGGKPFAVKVGETIDGSFVVQKVDFDAVVIGYVDSRFAGRTETVRLSAPTAAKGGR